MKLLIQRATCPAFALCYDVQLKRHGSANGPMIPVRHGRDPAEAWAFLLLGTSLPAQPVVTVFHV
jgi:hypothetical protein